MASRRTRSGLLASALVVGTVIAAGSAFLPVAPAPRAGTALATVASVAAVSQPAFAEEAGFLNLGKIELGGERREATFLFTDLAGFTSLVESAAPDLIVELLNP